MGILATITIGMNPNLIDLGPVVLSWHGLLTFVAVAVSVFLVYRWGTKEGMGGDPILSVAVWCIIGGIIGARVLHVIDFWGDVYQHNPLLIIQVWQGGIAVIGAILGGFTGGALYIIIRNSDRFLAFWGKFFRWAGEPHKAPLPGIGHLADVAAPAILISMAIGRVGDIINGEHFAKATNLPWGVFYTHPNSPGVVRAVSHPAVAYEIILDLVVLAIIWPLRHRLRPRGMVFVLYGALYSMGRFFLSFLRVETNTYAMGLNEAQIVSLLIMLIAIPVLVYKAQIVRPQA
jgi:phosphatidylglycerol:prolipoprotein diacylglycerol transferase